MYLSRYRLQTRTERSSGGEGTAWASFSPSVDTGALAQLKPHLRKVRTPWPLTYISIVRNTHLTKYSSSKSNLRKKWFVSSEFKIQPIMMWKSSWQKPETSFHIMTSVRSREQWLHTASQLTFFIYMV